MITRSAAFTPSRRAHIVSRSLARPRVRRLPQRNTDERRICSKSTKDPQPYVPSDSFGGQSPERKASTILRTFFTFVAARIVLAQLEGSGRGALGAYDSTSAQDLQHFLLQVPMKDGDEWLAALMRKNSSLALRLMEVRDSYCAEAFEWDQLQRLSQQEMKAANTRLMRTFAAASLAASMAGVTGGSGGSGDEAAAEEAAGTGAEAGKRTEPGINSSGGVVAGTAGGGDSVSSGGAGSVEGEAEAGTGAGSSSGGGERDAEASPGVDGSGLGAAEGEGPPGVGPASG